MGSRRRLGYWRDRRHAPSFDEFESKSITFGTDNGFTSSFTLDGNGGCLRLRVRVERPPFPLRGCRWSRLQLRHRLSRFRLRQPRLRRLPSVAPSSSGSHLPPSPAGVAVESPGTRAARLGALAAEREKELLSLAQLDKVAKAQKAAEERAYQQVLADRAKEQEVWNRKLADQQKQLDDGDNAVRQLTTWTKKMEQDRTALQGKLADDVKKATDERARLDAERLRLVNTVEGLRTDQRVVGGGLREDPGPTTRRAGPPESREGFGSSRGGIAENETPRPPERDGCGCGSATSIARGVG